MEAFPNAKLCHTNEKQEIYKNDGIYKSKALPFAWAGKIIKKMGALTNAKLCNADEMKIL